MPQEYLEVSEQKEKQNHPVKMVDLEEGPRKGTCECGCGLKTNVPKENDKSSHYIKGVPMRFISGHNLIENNNVGINNKNWKGDNVGYLALHAWVARQLGKPKKCEDCRTSDPNKKYQWANISGGYKRDLKDFKRLCLRCHRSFDNHLLLRGEMINTAKLKKGKILKIRKLRLKYGYIYRILAKKFSVSSSTIYKIIKRKSWKHIK